MRSQVYCKLRNCIARRMCATWEGLLAFGEIWEDRRRVSSGVLQLRKMDPVNITVKIVCMYILCAR